MKKFIIAAIVLFSSITAFTQENGNKIKFDKEHQEAYLCGEINVNDLKGDVFGSFFNNDYQEYTPDQEVMMNLLTLEPANYNYIIVLGSWCSDSRREVPGMIKVLNEIGIKNEQIKIIAVNFEKLAPGTGIETLNIEKVPTLIVMAGDDEVGRIVESPDESIEKDLLQILRN